MNPEKGNYNENEQLEREEQGIGEPAVTKEEDEKTTLEKRMEESDSRENDIANGWMPEL